MSWVTIWNYGPLLASVKTNTTVPQGRDNGTYFQPLAPGNSRVTWTAIKLLRDAVRDTASSRWPTQIIYSMKNNESLVNHKKKKSTSFNLIFPAVICICYDKNGVNQFILFINNYAAIVLLSWKNAQNFLKVLSKCYWPFNKLCQIN